jgi:hypothetical protein
MQRRWRSWIWPSTDGLREDLACPALDGVASELFFGRWFGPGGALAAVREGLFMAGSVSTRPRQSAEFGCVGMADQCQLSAKPGN